MTVNYTTLLKLAQPVTGTESGTWGDYVNNAISAYLDAAIAGTQTISTDNSPTLTLTEGTNSATNLGSTSAQYAIINLTGNRTSARTITLPSTSRHYIILNNTTGGFATTFSPGSISVAQGEDCVLAYDTSVPAYVKVASTISNVGSVTGTLAVGNGGTGATTLTANNVLLGNGTSALQVVAPGNSGNLLTSNGTTWGSTGSLTGIRAAIYTAGTHTFTVPAGVTAVRVFVVAGGGGGGNASTGGSLAFSSAGGGGGGGAGQGWVSVTPGASIAVTVGSGGAAAAVGGSSSFGAFITTTGGAAGGSSGNNATASGGAGGSAAGAALVSTGTTGGSGTTTSGGCCITVGVGGTGGTVFLPPMNYGAGGGGAVTPGFGNGGAGGGYGAGGGGGAIGNQNIGARTVSGGVGAPGIVIVEY